MRRLVKGLCILWLITGLPLLGIMPLVYVLFKRSLPHEIIWIWWAILRLVWPIFWKDPEPGTEHIPPSFGDKGYSIVAAVAIGITLLDLYWLSKHRSYK